MSLQPIIIWILISVLFSLKAIPIIKREHRLIKRKLPSPYIMFFDLLCIYFMGVSIILSIMYAALWLIGQ